MEELQTKKIFKCIKVQHSIKTYAMVSFIIATLTTLLALVALIIMCAASDSAMGFICVISVLYLGCQYIAFCNYRNQKVCLIILIIFQIVYSIIIIIITIFFGFILTAYYEVCYGSGKDCYQDQDDDWQCQKDNGDFIECKLSKDDAYNLQAGMWLSLVAHILTCFVCSCNIISACNMKRILVMLQPTNQMVINTTFDQAFQVQQGIPLAQQPQNYAQNPAANYPQVGFQNFGNQGSQPVQYNQQQVQVQAYNQVNQAGYQVTNVPNQQYPQYGNVPEAKKMS